MIEVIHRYADTPIEYGKTDCCQFVGECLQAVYGVNPAKDFDYDTEIGMRRQIGRFGSLEKLLTATLGKPSPNPHEYDVALIEDQQVVGIVFKGRIVARTENDIVDLPLHRSRRFWSCRQ